MAQNSDLVWLLGHSSHEYKIPLTQELKSRIMDGWHYWTVFVWKGSSRSRYTEFWTLSGHVNWIFVTEIEWIECEWGLVSARWRIIKHKPWNNRINRSEIWWLNNFKKLWSELTFKIVRFDPVGLFSLGLLER